MFLSSNNMIYHNMHQDLPSFSVHGYVIHTFYYDQFMNKTHVESMKNIC